MASGDFDGDGLGDLFVSFGLYYSVQGAVAGIFLGSTISVSSGVLPFNSADVLFLPDSSSADSAGPAPVGFDSAEATDLNGDGRDDLLLGSAYYTWPDGGWTGRAYILFSTL